MVVGVISGVWVCGCGGDVSCMGVWMCCILYAWVVLCVGCCMWWDCVFILHTYSWGIRIVVLLCVSVCCWVAILLLQYCISC